LPRRRVRVADLAAHRVPEVHLPLEVVVPGGRVRVLEVGHEAIRARVERVDHHLPVHRARDLDDAAREIGGNRGAAPASFPDVARLGEEVERGGRVEAVLAGGEEGLDDRPEAPGEIGDEAESRVGENFLVAWA
jgi:hypothetical protein